jgi:hypothetical protein
VLITTTRRAMLATRGVREDPNARTTPIATAMLQALMQNLVTRWHECVTRKEVQSLNLVQIRRRLVFGPGPDEIAR